MSQNYIVLKSLHREDKQTFFSTCFSDDTSELQATESSVFTSAITTSPCPTSPAEKHKRRGMLSGWGLRWYFKTDLLLVMVLECYFIGNLKWHQWVSTVCWFCFCFFGALYH